MYNKEEIIREEIGSLNDKNKSVDRYRINALIQIILNAQNEIKRQNETMSAAKKQLKDFIVSEEIKQEDII